MLTLLVAYDAAGNIIATLDYLVARDADGNVTGLLDFAAHEEAGGELLDVWNVEGATGSKTWPEWLGSRAHDFRIEKDGEPGAKRIVALVHKDSGHRRERAVIEDAIANRITKAKGAPADIRDIVGGPDRPLLLNDEGKTARPKKVVPSELPVIPMPSPPA